jgi:tetratricopeptide (TPR) repeat protein
MLTKSGVLSSLRFFYSSFFATWLNDLPVMIETKKTIVHEDLIDFMSLIAERNRTGIEKKLAELSGALDNQTGDEAQALSSIIKGLSSFFNNKYVEARAHFAPVIEREKLSGSIRGVALMGQGFTCRSMGKLDEAVAQLTAASECIDPKGRFRSFLMYCYQQLGDIHTTIHENEVALQYFEKSYDAAGRVTEGLAYFRYHMGLGHCYLSLKDHTRSEEHYHRALQVKNIPANVISKIENDLGTMYLETRQFEQAEKFLSSSLAVREANKLEDAVCTTMTNLAEVYLGQGRTDDAFRLLERCSDLVEKFDTKAKKLQVLKLLAHANRLVRNNDRAIEYYEQYIALYDDLKREQERNIFKFKNKQIEKQKQIIDDKHRQLTDTFNEIKRLKVNRKAALFSWITIIILVVISELFIDPLIENYSYNTILSLLLKVGIALLFKPIDGMYENILWKRAISGAVG